MDQQQQLIDLVLEHEPETEAIYLYGSWGTEYQRPDSDVDLALLLPPQRARQAGVLLSRNLRGALQDLLERELDLVNARLVPTVLRKEIIMADRRIYTGNVYAADEFEMLTISYYQKLNLERATIIAEALSSSRFYDV